MIQIAKYDLEGNYLETLEAENYSQLAKLANVDISSLMNNLESRVLSCENFQFKPFNTRNKPFTKLPEVWSQNGVSLKLFGKYYKNKLISTYNAVDEAEKKNAIDKAGISRCLNGVNKTAGGYTWKYLD